MTKEVNMIRFIIKRLWQAVLVLIGVSIISFGLIHLTPGNPARLMLPDGATQEQVTNMEKRLGLDKPLYVQYFTYMKGLVQGDLGDSLFYAQPCAKLIAGRLPPTILLTLAAMLLSLIIAIPLGLIAGTKRGTGIDVGAMFFALLGQSMSPVWVGLLLILVFAVQLHWLPTLGYGTLANYIMPSITLGLPMAALVTRLMRSGMIEILQEDYITSAYAKGIRKLTVICKYAFKNAVIPVITIVGLQVGAFLGGAVTTEQIFGWPGIGTLTVQAINLRDFPLVQAILITVSALFVLVNLIVDILYTVADPRLNLN